MYSRRKFNTDLFLLASTSVFPILSCKDVLTTSVATDPRFQLSLAEWSFHRAIKGGKLDHLDFAAKAKALNFAGVEYVNQFFLDKAKDKKYLSLMNERANDAGINQLLIMVDSEGGLANLDETELLQAVDKHKKWVDAAAFLDCHSIRVNCFGVGDADDVKQAGIKGLSLLAEFAQKSNINVIVENHGGNSSDGIWMSDVLRQVNLSNCGSLPDFGNFCVEREDGAMWGKPCIKEYDKYKGVEELMPYAKAVSAKSYDFDAQGNETSIDFKRMMELVKASKYKGYIGVEYEGENLGEEAGIIKTRDLLLRHI